MERRALLIGSGAAFATVLAGCTGSENGDDDGGGNGVGVTDGDDDGTDGGTDDGTGNGDAIEDVPGFDESELDLDEYGLTIHRVKRDGSDLHVEVEATVTTLDEEHLDRLIDALAAAVVDVDSLKGTISTIEVAVVDEDGVTIVSFYANVAWIVDYLEGELTEDELSEKVSDTVN